MSTATKLEYLNETKSKIKDNINLTGAGLTNQTPFRQYATGLKTALLNILNNGIDTLYNNFPQLNDEGQNISLTPTLEAPIKSELLGNTTQKTTTGKNILPQNEYISSQTINGITYTNNGDGTFNLSGTATANTSLRIIDTGIFNLESGQAYYLYSSVPYNNNTFNMSIITIESGTNYYFIANSSHTPPVTPTNSRLQFYIANGNSVNVQNVKLMLVKGSTAPTEYEPYTNGASPNPDFPQEVINATGGQEVSVVGKNLWDENTQVFTNQSRFNNPTKDSNNVWNFTITGSNGYAFATSKITLQAGTYTASAIVDNGDFIILKGSVTQPNTFTLTEDTEITFRVYKNGNIGDVVKLSNVMIEKGSIVTEYEAYKEQSYEINLGKNLFDKNTSIVTGKTYTGTGDITTLNNSFIQETYIPVSSSTAYTMSTTNNYSSENDYRLVICEYKDDKTFIKRNLGGSVVGNKYTITTTENTKYVRLCASTVTLDELQFEKGQATSYVPYLEFGGIGNYQDSIRKSTGKNLFDKSTITTSTYLKEDGTLQTGTGAEYVTSDFIPVKPNTTYYKTLTLSPRTKFYDKNKQVLDNTTYQDVSIGGNAGSFTTPSNAYYFRFTGNVNTSTGININLTMINEGSTALPYEPYGSKGKWLLTKKIGKVVLDGSENWTINGYTFVLNGTFPLTLNSLCSHFIKQNDDTWQSYNTSYRGKYTLANSINQFKVMPTDANINTVELWKQWLQSNNVLVYYVLATPTVEEITDSTLLNDLNNLEDAKSYNGTTNIIITGETPADLKITVLKNE